MSEESHLEEMSAAIRAQRERHAAPRSMISAEDARPPERAREDAAPAEPAPAKRGGLFARLRRR